jgi:Mg2+ and Co2+ transporter CorA
MDNDETVVPNDENIVDSQIEAETVDSTIDTENVTSFINLEDIIKNHIDSIAKMREELKSQREMFEDSFNNNPTFREHSEKVKEAMKGKALVKKQISSQPSVALLASKIKELRMDINDKNQTLSDLLRDYSEQTGATSIETKNGLVLEIVSTMKLVKRNSK